MTPSATSTTLKVSVVVPAYQPGEGIRRVVDSLAAQSMPQDEFELIIVDDGSPDDTWSRLEAIRDERPNVRIKRIENSGWPSRPRNIGIEIARGEYVLFMDHDDEILPDGLRASYEYATAHHADVLSPKELKTSDPRWGLGNYTANIPNALPRRGINALMPMMPHKFYRRAFLLEHDIRFPEGRRMLWEDVYFNVECFKHAQVVSILSDTPVYLWHATDQNNSATYGPWEDEFWEKLAALFDFITTALATESLAAARQTQLMHQYRLRVLSRLTSYLRSVRTPEHAQYAVERAAELTRRHIPEDWDASLPALDRPKAWLLRRRRVDQLRELEMLDSSVVGHSTVDAIWWEKGTLRIRATARWTDSEGRPVPFRKTEGRLHRVLPPSLDELPIGLRDVTEDVRAASSHLTLRDDLSKATWNLKSRSQVALERMARPGTAPEPPQGSMVSVAVSTITNFSPATAAQGKAVADAEWVVNAKSRLLGELSHHPVRSAAPPRPAMVGGRAVVAARSKHGALTIDVGQVRHGILDHLRPDWMRGTVTTSGKGLLRRHTVDVPVHGLHADAPAQLSGAAGVLLHSAAERHGAIGPIARLLARATPERGVATLKVAPTGSRLTAIFHAPTWRWQLRPRLADGPRTARGWDVTAPPAANEAARPRRTEPSGGADVTVIIPAYNVSRYVEESVRSVFAQTLAPERVEIVVVDDGSTDDTLAILEQLATEHPRMRVIAQQNSGSASRPRNVALDHATGTYVFCLDADDLLTPWALERLVGTAEATGSDVVLGRLKGIGGRGQPSTTFRRTVLDADLAEDHLFHAMTPHKLFRRSHIEDNGLRFPEDISVGEDVLFVAAAELKARRIAILADDDYYLWRLRDDSGEHLSKSGPGFETIFEKASRLETLIREHVEPGLRRDALMRRVSRYVYHGLVRNIWKEQDGAVRAQMAARSRERFRGIWNDGLRSHLPPHLQLPLWLLFAGDRDDDLVAVADHAHGDVRRLHYAVEDGHMVVALPRDLSSRIPLDWRRATEAMSTTANLLQLEKGPSGVTIHVEAAGKRVLTPPETVLAELRPHAGDGARVVLPVEVSSRRERGPVTCAITLDSLAVPGDGEWNLAITPVWGTISGAPTKVGRKISEGADENLPVDLDKTTHLSRRPGGALVVCRA
ncbi:glycosyltransferase family 2 protein [Isoptericola aurantiacus]|uniref:glycosyltransferase family 2 protein n=1 Tax=Isoptericola aurantiacus TaxID=3377839 RepID=UPI00383BB14D